MERTLLKTGDGSYTLHLPDWDEQYHSKNGAIAEALHVFIKTGLDHWVAKTSSLNVSILEIGFGTGLNTILTFLESQIKNLKIQYTGVEGFPLSAEEANSLKYPELLQGIYNEYDLQEIERIFFSLHKTPWQQETAIADNFVLTKQQKKFDEISDHSLFNIIYFDAFGIRVQPELWTEAIFKKMFQALKPDGILVTYAANGNARRAMQAVGFSVERLPGPPGKKEMLRATKV